MPPPTLPSRDSIRRAATEMFIREGYAGTTVRAIAAAAGCDPALVIRHFGSKEALFLATVSISAELPGILDGPIESLGRRLVGFVLDAVETPMPGVYRAMVSASDRPEIKERLRASLHDVFVGPLADRIGGDCPELRARLVAAQFAGLVNAYWLVADPVLCCADRPAIVALYGDAIQRLLDSAGPGDAGCADPG